MEKTDPIDVANHFLVKQEPSTAQNALSSEEIEYEVDTALYQSSDDSNEHKGQDIPVSIDCLQDWSIRRALGCVHVVSRNLWPILLAIPVMISLFSTE